MPSAVRRPGGGRKRIEDKCPDIKDRLESLVNPLTQGDPESPLRWTCKSVRVLANALNKMGIQVSHVAVAGLLKDMGYSLQVNQKVKEGSFHSDRRDLVKRFLDVLDPPGESECDQIRTPSIQAV